MFIHRLLKNLKLVWGSGETKVLVVIDGDNDESIQIASLFDTDIVIHRPQGNPGDNTRY